MGGEACFRPIYAGVAPWSSLYNLLLKKLRQFLRSTAYVRRGSRARPLAAATSWPGVSCGLKFLFIYFLLRPSRRSFDANLDGIGRGDNETMSSTQRIYRALTLLAVGVFTVMVAAKILMLFAKLVGL